MTNHSKIILVAIMCALAILVLALTQKPKSIEEIRKEAYRDIVGCALGGDSSKAKLKFEEIRWEVVKGTDIIIPSMDGNILVAKGIFNIYDSTIYIVSNYHRKPWTIKHELAHAIGFIGHPFHPFVTCRLLPEMN